MLSAVVASASIALSSAYSAVVVSAGTLYGIGGSTVSAHPTANPAVVVALYGAGQNDNSIHLLLDLGNPQDVTALDLINRRDVGTDMSIRTLQIFIAADEDASGFDPMLLSNYTINVLPNTLLEPSNNTQGAVRSVDVADFNRRWVLININSNFVGGSEGISHSGNRAQVQIGDIVAIPEPNTLGMISLFGTLVALGAYAKRDCKVVRGSGR